jgi:hypothetical protein
MYLSTNLGTHSGPTICRRKGRKLLLIIKIIPKDFTIQQASISEIHSKLLFPYPNLSTNISQISRPIASTTNRPADPLPKDESIRRTSGVKSKSIRRSEIY